MAPVVRIDDCAVTIFCEGGFSLVAFDKDTATDFGAYQIDGQCNPYSQTWQVADVDSGLLQTYTKLYVACVDFKTVPVTCAFRTGPPLVLAYSNDLNPEQLSDTIALFSGTPANPLYFKTYAVVRFDTQVEDEMSWFTDWQSFTQYPTLKYPNPELSFIDSNQGSDIFKVIDKFLANERNQICKSTMMILLKRWPTEQYIDFLVAKLKRLRVSLYIFATESPPSTAVRSMLYSLAVITQGFCSFNEESSTNNGRLILQTYKDPYLAYIANLYNLTGKGKIELPSITIGLEEVYSYKVSLLYPLTPPSRIILKWYSSNVTLSLDSNEEHSEHAIGSWLGDGLMVGRTKYNCSFEYDFPATPAQSVQIRLGSA